MSLDDGIIRDLHVHAQGVYQVQVSSGLHALGHRRVDVHAEVDTRTGEVRFYVAPEDLDKLR